MALFPNELAPRSYRNMADTVLKWTQDHPQLCGAKHNRLIQQCKLYIKTEGIIQVTNPDWLFYVQGLKDIQEYWFIIEILGKRLLKAPFIEPLKLSLQDPDLPKDSKDSTLGRNTQFELFIAAIASRAGMNVDRLGDSGADWVLTATGNSWSIETKRIKSLDQMEKHIRKAGKQIMATNKGGIIAIDISLAVNPSCAPLSKFVSDDDIQQAHRMRTDHFAQKFLPSIRRWIGIVLSGS